METTTSYRPVKGFPGYRVDKQGMVQTCLTWKGQGYGRKPVVYLSDTWRDLKPDVDARGRRRFTVRKNNRSYKLKASRVVLEAFVGPCPEGMECCHNNGNESDDRLENLRWDTHSSNLMDRREHGTAPRGEMISTSKLTESDIRDIRSVGYPLGPLADKYGVSKTMISLILRRKAWQHVE